MIVYFVLFFHLASAPFWTWFGDILFVIICAIRELKQGRRQRQRRRQKTMIWLVECGKVIVLHVRHALQSILDVVCQMTTWNTHHFKVLTTTWTHNSKSFILCMFTSTTLLPVHLQPSLSTMKHARKKQYSQSSHHFLYVYFEWRFHCRCRRCCLSSLWTSHCFCSIDAFSSI